MEAADQDKNFFRIRPMVRALIVRNVSREGPGLISEVFRDAGIECAEIDLDRGDAWPDLRIFDLLIVLGGPDSANDETKKIREELNQIRSWLESGKPYLGICLGMQLLVKAAGGEVLKSPVKEVGFLDPAGKSYSILPGPAGKNDPLFKNLPEPLEVFQLHGETVKLPAAMELLATGEHCRVQAVRGGEGVYGLQCHFEVTRDLLEVWSLEDNDLKKLDRAELLNEYKKREDQYKQTGRKLIENFLTAKTAGRSS